MQLPPDLVLAIALPPLLFGAGYYADPGALRSDLRPVALLAVGLVLATAAGVTVALHSVVHGLPWPADLLGASGVIAAVTVGIYLGRRDFQITSRATRLQASGFWDVLTFLLNAALFVLVGLQLRPMLSRLGDEPLGRLVTPVLVVIALGAGIRLAWEFTSPYLVRALDRRPGQRDRRSGAGFRLVIAWSGMRGAVSLAAALALPDDFPQRDLMVVITFAVILATLVGQGLTQGPLLTLLKLGTVDQDRDELHARIAATDAGVEEQSQAYQRTVHEVLEAQRRRLAELREAGEIPADVVQRIGHELDLEDSRLDS